MTKDTGNIDGHQAAEDQHTDSDGCMNNGAEQPNKDEAEARQAIEAVRKFANENEDEDSGEFSIKSIIGGDFLMSKFIIHQVVFVIFCVLLMIFYTGNRYDSQQDTIMIDSLRTELQNVKYNVLTQSSELMNLIRQSNVEERLRHTKDSLLHNSVTPPFLIKMNEDDEEEEAAPTETREVVIGEAPIPVSGEEEDNHDETENKAEEKKESEAEEETESKDKAASAHDNNKKSE